MLRQTRYLTRSKEKYAYILTQLMLLTNVLPRTYLSSEDLRHRSLALSCITCHALHASSNNLESRFFFFLRRCTPWSIHFSQSKYFMNKKNAESYFNSHTFVYLFFTYLQGITKTKLWLYKENVRCYFPFFLSMIRRGESARRRHA